MWAPTYHCYIFATLWLPPCYFKVSLSTPEIARPAARWSQAAMLMGWALRTQAGRSYVCTLVENQALVAVEAVFLYHTRLIGRRE